jgi:hypothetical protein
MKKTERRMENLGMWGEREVKESGVVELFLRDHIEKKMERLYAPVATAEMKWPDQKMK